MARATPTLELPEASREALRADATAAAWGREHRSDAPSRRDPDRTARLIASGWALAAAAVLVAYLAPLGPAATRTISALANGVLLGGVVVGGALRAIRARSATERLGWLALAFPFAAAPFVAPLDPHRIRDMSDLVTAVHVAPLAQLGSIAAVFLLIPENRRAVRSRRALEVWWPYPLLLGVLWTAAVEPVVDLPGLDSTTTIWLVLPVVLLAAQEALYLVQPDRRSDTVAGARSLIVASMMVGGSQVAFIMELAGGHVGVGGAADGFRIAAIALVGVAITLIRAPGTPSAVRHRTSSRHAVVLPIAVAAAVVLRIAIGASAGDVVFWIGMILAMAHLGRTIGERDQLVDVLRRQATTDALTGLANRTTLRSHLDEIIAARAAASIVYLDLDGFKMTNDELGHAAGDQLLVTTAERIRDALPVEALVARVGGDEFVAVLPCDGEEAVAMAESTVRAIAAPVDLEGTIVEPRVSAGLSPVTADTDRALDQADMALYRAKRDPTSRLRLFDEAIRTEEHRRARIESALPAILDRGLLHVHYQAIVDIRTGRWRGVEALVRWPDEGEFSALEIVEAAERLRLTDRLTEEVMARVAVDLPEIQALTGLPLWCTVNVSVLGGGRSIPRMLDAAFGRPGGPEPRDIVVEIAEQQLPDDIDALRGMLSGIRTRGYRIAIDDFGAGYSALSHLGRLPFDMLKLDGAFTRGLPVGLDLIELVVRLSHGRRAVVVAESVEHPRQAAAMAHIGCDLGQGYLWQRPVAVESLRRCADLRVRAAGTLVPPAPSPVSTN